VQDGVYEEARRQFSEKELADLTPGGCHYQCLESAGDCRPHYAGDLSAARTEEGSLISVASCQLPFPVFGFRFSVLGSAFRLGHSEFALNYLAML